MTKEIASIHVQAKLTPAEYEPFRLIIEETGIKKATLFRHVILANKQNVFVPEKQSTDKKRLIFIASKSSNNLNQIARQLNSAYRGGVVSERVYLDVLNKLVSLESFFKKAIEKC